MPNIAPLEQLDAKRFETLAILKKLASNSHALAELKRALCARLRATLSPRH